MWKLLSYLHGSELVASFQRTCGLFPLPEAASQSAEPVHLQGHDPLLTRDPGGLAQKRRGHGNGHSEANGTRTEPQEGNNYTYKYAANGCRADREYEVRNRPLHFLFLVSASLGSEVCYISLFPWLHWSLDPWLCRRLVNVWALVMYIGQVMKDVLKLPRPLAPPVVKLEKRVDAEYGLPSTHAMAATAITFTLLLSAQERIQFQFEVGLVLAVGLSALVCLSRLYTGMHSALDVICGVLISAVVVAITHPFWAAFDRLQLDSPLSPIVVLVLALLLCWHYPALDHYSPTRGDTTIILAASAGYSAGYWLDRRLGGSFPALGPLPMTLPPLTLATLGRGAARLLVGVGVLVATRQAARWASLRAVCRWHGVLPGDGEARQRREVEVPYKYVTYCCVGLVNCLLVNRLLTMLGLL